jgi:hypothetical protein
MLIKANQRLEIAMGPDPRSQNRPLVDNLPRYINQLELGKKKKKKFFLKILETSK